MSAVELPLVPSARSSSSSASSSRSHLHSAGSINSEKSARTEEAQQEEEEPQESSGGGLWDEVEHFLNKPSPSLSNLSGKTSKAPVNKPPKSTLPTLNARRASPDNQTTYPSRPASKTIDPKLLQEAFAYANQLQQMNFDDDDGDADEQQQSWRNSKTKMLMQRAALGRANSSSSSSSLSSNAASGGLRGSRAGGGKGSSSVSTDARKKKGKPTSSSAYGSAVKSKGSKPKGHMDPQTLQALVSNFQNGTTLEELRRELAASQQSMAMSRQVLQEAAQTFFQSH
ncbi:hypothetical protein PHYSODRAFT_316808 [Phytophthora sojae]|uniref:Uncharacterized protein n=1 Tax=Phytophthora sojae (strain P6497) TaxID=1094619 RepID=G4ZRC0_PHYSP|nr:hypothetical protein PHYSODRAFT_316808 [Phytophthora sojae]EGZ13805.1 hypothetical protein PHYSODRAFT_316808 [Phytophthora sojae]|eukprot:XP_009531234.1 hypothetical protein PHYSODRAFT_316808 [Phytophthora sojae]